MSQELWWAIGGVIAIPIVWVFLYGVGKALGLGWHQSKVEILRKTNDRGEK